MLNPTIHSRPLPSYIMRSPDERKETLPEVRAIDACKYNASNMTHASLAKSSSIPAIIAIF